MISTKVKSLKREQLAVPTPPAPPSLRKVVYLHRTVRDFIESSQIKERITQMTGMFIPYPALLISSVFMAKKWRCSDQRWHQLEDHVRQAMLYASEIEKTGALNGELLDEIEKCVSRIVSNEPTCMGGRLRTGEHWATSCTSSETKVKPGGFLSSAACHSLFSYISGKVVGNLQLFPDEARRPPLDRIITEYQQYPSLCEPGLLVARRKAPSVALIQHLHNNGSDPNHLQMGKLLG
jgi:hypothetical protein